MNTADNDGNRPLHFAISGNHGDVVRYLVESGADRSLQNNLMNAPIHQAVDINNKEMLQVRNE